MTESFFGFLQKSHKSPNLAGSPQSGSSTSPRTNFFQIFSTIPVAEPIPPINLVNEAGIPIQIYDINDEAKLFRLHHQIIVEVNRLFASHDLPQIPPDFIASFHEQVFDKAPPEKPWYVRLFGGGGKGKVVPNNSDTPVADYNLSVRKSCQISSVPLKTQFRIPTLVYNCATKIKYDASTIGIFRISGNAKRISKLTSIYSTPPDYGANYTIEPEYNTFDVADTLKKYFKSLEEPLFTVNLHQYFLVALELPESSRIRCTQLLTMLLPRENSILLAFLLETIQEVAIHERENQMPVSNLAIVFGPNLMRASTVNQTLLDHNKVMKFLTLLIQNYATFQLDNFSVAGLMISSDVEKSTPKTLRVSEFVAGAPRKSAMKSKDNLLNGSSSQELGVPTSPKMLLRSNSTTSHKSVNFGATMVVGYGAPRVDDDDDADGADVPEKPKSLLERLHVHL